MISVKCPHCHVGLKVDEGKLPLDLTSFKCPKCKQPIPVSLLQLGKQGLDADQDTILVNPVSNGTGQLTVVGACYGSVEGRWMACGKCRCHNPGPATQIGAAYHSNEG